MAVTIKSTSVSVSFCLSNETVLLQVDTKTVDVCMFVVVNPLEFEHTAQVE